MKKLLLLCFLLIPAAFSQVQPSVQGPCGNRQVWVQTWQGTMVCASAADSLASYPPPDLSIPVTKIPSSCRVGAMVTLTQTDGSNAVGLYYCFFNNNGVQGLYSVVAGGVGCTLGSVVSGQLIYNNAGACATATTTGQDTNVPISVTGGNIAITWTGTLAKNRIISSAVFNDQANTYTAAGSIDLSLGKLTPPVSTVSGLPAASSNNHKVYLVTDGSSASDCASGSGTSLHFCLSNGTSWVAEGGGGGGGGTIASTTDILQGDGAGNANSAGVQASGLPITSAVTYYFCAHSGTCKSTDTGNGFYNGGAGFSATPSDANNCTSATTPCATFSGVLAKYPKRSLGAIVTVYSADNANTTTDCVSDASLIINNPSLGQLPDAVAERTTSPSYPAAYIYVYGNPTTPANSTWALNGCGTTTASSTNRSAFSVDGNTAVRINGFQIEGAGKSDPAFTAFFSVVNGILYAENITCIGANSNHNACVGAMSSKAVVRIGGTWTISGGGQEAFLAANGGNLFTWDPLATSSSNTVINHTLSNNTITFLASEAGRIWYDRTTATLTGTTGIFLEADWHSTIMYTEAYTGVGECPSGNCLATTLNASGLTYQKSTFASYIDADCTVSNQSTCTVTQQPTTRSYVASGGIAREYETAAGCGLTQNITASDSFQPGGIVSHFLCGSTPSERFDGQLSLYSGQITVSTAALGSAGLVGSGACATNVITVSLTGLKTTDVFKVGFSADPTSVTGFGNGSTTGILSVYAYPTANTGNIKVCNWTGSSITLGSTITLNYAVNR